MLEASMQEDMVSGQYEGRALADSMGYSGQSEDPSNGSSYSLLGIHDGGLVASG